jgi:hypothetical protein
MIIDSTQSHAPTQRNFPLNLDPKEAKDFVKAKKNQSGLMAFLHSNRHSTGSTTADAFAKNFDNIYDLDINEVYEFIKTRDNYPFDYWVGKNLDLSKLNQEELSDYLSFINFGDLRERGHFAQGFAANPSLKPELILEEVLKRPDSKLAQGFMENPNTKLALVKDTIDKNPGSRLALASRFPGSKTTIYNGSVETLAA